MNLYKRPLGAMATFLALAALSWLGGKASAAPADLGATLENPSHPENNVLGISVATLGRNIIVGDSIPITPFASHPGSAFLLDGVPTCAPGILNFTYNNPAPGDDDQAGYAVAALGNDVLVGAPLDNTSAIDGGSVYLFSGSTGDLLLTIRNPTPEEGDLFGWAVSAVGGNILVGARHDKTGADGAGSVYLFDGTLTGVTSTPLLTIHNPTPLAGDAFGWSVASLGVNILVGAMSDDTGALDTGSVYLFNGALTGTTSTPLLTINNPTPQELDQFGYFVAALGNNILVGAPSDNTNMTDAGSAYLFNGLLTGTTSTPLLTINDPAALAGDSFGISVAAVGNNILVGAPNDDAGALNAGSAYLFNGALTGTTSTPLLTIRNPTPASTELFGLSLSAVGSDILVSAYQDGTGASAAGSVYLFSGALTGTTSAPLLTINNPTPGVFDGFGFSVAAVGERILVGGYGDDTGMTNAGSAYLFYGATCPTPTPIPTATPTCAPGALMRIYDDPPHVADDEFGSSIAAMGNNFIVGAIFDDTGATNAGSVYLFDGVDGALLLTINNPAPVVEDQFGYSVAAVGNNILVGGYRNNTGAGQAGIAYLFNGTLRGTTNTPLLTILNPTPGVIDHFGWSVAAVGNHLLVAAPGDSTGAPQAGSVYLFDGALQGTTSTPMLTINNPDPVELDEFGWSVAGVGNNILVGAIYNDTGAIDAGSAYLFSGALSGTTNAPLLTIKNPTPEFNDNFGLSVASSGTNILIGAPYDNTGDNAAGSVYLFDGTLTGTTNTPLLTINNPTPGLNDQFGFSISALGGNLLVGAPYDFIVPGLTGSAYLFDGSLTGTMSAPLLTIHNPFPGDSGNRFGQSVAAVDARILVSEPGGDASATNAGSVYLFFGNECLEPTPTPSPTSTPQATVPPTPTPTPTATTFPSPTPAPFAQGYFPAAGGAGEAIVFLDDRTPPNPGIHSYRIQVRRVDNPTVVVQSVVFNLPGGPGAVESHSSQFTLPLLDALIPTSWEIDVQYKTQAFGGLNATGETLLNVSYSYASHPSSDVSDPPLFTNPPVLAGTENLQLTDHRATAKKGAYKFDIIRDILFGPVTQVGQLNHGITGPFPTSKVHGEVSVSAGVTVVSGDSNYYIRTRREFRNSQGTSVGRYDIAPQSPAAEVSAP